MEDYPGNHLAKSESKKSTGTEISSDTKSNTKTFIVNEYNETLEIKEEIVQDHERHENSEQHLLLDRNRLDEKSTSVNNSSAKTLIEYSIDETLEIKEEIIQEQETVTSQKDNKKSPNVDTREADISSLKNVQNRKKRKIQELNQKAENKYNCEKCARSYKRKTHLNRHKKFDCDVMPQFSCEFCDKQFKFKQNRTAHTVLMHQKTISNRKEQKVQESHQEPEKKYKCEKCARRYKQKSSLISHQKYQCNVRSQFRCDCCAKQFNTKSLVKRHIDQVHQKRKSSKSQLRHNCDECSRTYTLLSNLNTHKRLYHAGVKAVKPQFICASCGYKTNFKYNLSKHMTARHFK